MRAYFIEIGWFGKIDSDVIDFFSIWQELGHVTPGYQELIFTKKNILL
jgi:hypothetical protein